MTRVFLGLASIFVSGLLGLGAAAAGDSKTVRVAPVAHYGAIVSQESGVRIFRPLPPTTHMIVNPNKTPLHLTFKDVTKNIYRSTPIYDEDGSAYSGRYLLGSFAGFGSHRRHRARMHRRGLRKLGHNRRHFGRGGRRKLGKF